MPVIRISYYGKPYVYHDVSCGFAERLCAYVHAHPKQDVVIRLSEYERDKETLAWAETVLWPVEPSTRRVAR
jgi:hypothetical protein